MKKLAVFFIILISLVVIAGCNSSKKTVTKFSADDATDTSADTAKTTITKVDEKGKTDTTAINIPAVIKTAPVNDVKFAVTTPSSDIAKSDKGYHLIQGTTPADTDKILVNDVPLSKYKAGTTQWNYIAAVSLGNLKKGDNAYTVKAVDKDGNVLGSQDLTIFYKGIDSGALASTGSNGITVISLALAMLISFMMFYARPLFIRIRN
jgi:hypothetical protein